MRSFQKNKLELLKELQEIISDTLMQGHITWFGDISEKRRNRNLKMVRKELDEWIKEIAVMESGKQEEYVKYNK